MSDGWQDQVRKWTKVGEDYDQVSQTVAAILVTYFTTRTAYQSNEVDIKEIISESLSERNKTILRESQVVIDTKAVSMRNDDDRRLVASRLTVTRTIHRLFKRLEEEIFGKPLPPSKKGYNYYQIL
jgi:hypothetical protein